MGFAHISRRYIPSSIKVTDMSSINDSGENEFAYEESNIVGISENSPDEKDKKILKSIKKKEMISEEEQEEEDKKE